MFNIPFHESVKFQIKLSNVTLVCCYCATKCEIILGIEKKAE